MSQSNKSPILYKTMMIPISIRYVGLSAIIASRLLSNGDRLTNMAGGKPAPKMAKRTASLRPNSRPRRFQRMNTKHNMETNDSTKGKSIELNASMLPCYGHRQEPKSKAHHGERHKTQDHQESAHRQLALKPGRWPSPRPLQSTQHSHRQLLHLASERLPCMLDFSYRKSRQLR